MTLQYAGVKPPLAPVAPVEPVDPVAPVKPIIPILPVGPVDPVAPVGPIGPPDGPVGPVLPTGPANSIIVKTICDVVLLIVVGNELIIFLAVTEYVTVDVVAGESINDKDTGEVNCKVLVAPLLFENVVKPFALKLVAPL